MNKLYISHGSSVPSQCDLWCVNANGHVQQWTNVNSINENDNKYVSVHGNERMQSGNERKQKSPE